MNRRAQAALRAIAIVELATVAVFAAVSVLRNDVLKEAMRTLETHALDKLALYNSITFWTAAVSTLLLLFAVILLATALGVGRRWAVAAGVLLSVHGCVLLVERVVPLSGPPPTWRHAMWLVDSLVLGLALMLPLVAAARARPSWLARIAVIGALALVALGAVPEVLEAAVTGNAEAATRLQTFLTWASPLVSLVSAAWFAGFAFPLAGRLAKQADDSADAARSALDGTPLKMLAWGLVGRIAMGVVLAAATLLWAAQGDYDSASAVMKVAGALDGLVNVLILIALVQYFRFPTTHRSDALFFAIPLLVLGAILDAYGTWSSSELFDIAAHARHATSFWEMPDISKLEDLQATVTWVGRAALALGVGAGLVIAKSLEETARALGNKERRRRAKEVAGLMLVLGTVALGLMFVENALARNAPMLFFLLALALLVGGLFLTTMWMQLLFGLAGELDQPAAEPAEEPAA